MDPGHWGIDISVYSIIVIDRVFARSLYRDGISNKILTSFNGAGDHGDDGDVDRRDDVEHRPDEVDLDGPVPLGVLPTEVRQAEDCQADADLQARRKRTSSALKFQSM